MGSASVISFLRGWSTRVGVWPSSHPADGKDGQGVMGSVCISPNSESSRLHKQPPVPRLTLLFCFGYQGLLDHGETRNAEQSCPCPSEPLTTS